MHLFYITIISICLLAHPLAVLAADQAGTAAAVASDSGFNSVLIGLVTLIIVLLFVIMMAANVIKQLSITTRERMKSERMAKRTAALGLLLLIIFKSPVSFAQDAAANAGTAVLSGIISGIREDVFYLIVGVIAFELLILFMQLIVIRTLLPVATGKASIKKVVKAVAKPALLDRFNQSVAVEKETAILLDHDYDGIKELDNNLPPWWKYGFYLTIVVAVLYMGYYELGSGPTSDQEYLAEVQTGEAEVAAYLEASASNVDENTVATVTDGSALSGAKNTFQTVCAACHAKDGGGGVGPNLTDAYWLHGGSLKNVFSSIKYGWQDKGMKSWKDDYSPMEIAALATYVRSLQGTRPAAPKEKQGDAYTEATVIATTAVPAAK